MLDETRHAAFVSHAQKGERVLSLDGSCAVAPLACDGCGRTLEPPLAFAPRPYSNESLLPPGVDDDEGVDENNSGLLNDDDQRYCTECRSSLLGPACQGCGQPTARADSVLAADAHWHKQCLRCSHQSCRALLGERYFAHEGSLFCREHYLEQAAERCAACDLVVDGGLRALGRAWHEGCLRCGESDVPLTAGEAFMHEGRPVAPAAREKTAPRCHACGEPATSRRVYAHGAVYHHDCFRCVHCRAIIGERRFVVFDTEPYLEGCYQKLFGASAGEALRAQLHGALRRYALSVPLLNSLGPAGLHRFVTKHEELLPHVRRMLREHGIVQFGSFLFQPPIVSKPSLVLHLQIPATLDAEEALPQLLQADRVGQQWEQLVASVHDVPSARGRAWYENIVQELGSQDIEDSREGQ